MVLQSANRDWVAGLAATAVVAAAGSFVLRPRGGVLRAAGVAASDYFDEADIERARRYERPQRVLHAANTAVGGATLALLVRLRAGTALERRPAGIAAADGAALSLALTIAGLPLGSLARKRALEAGIATQSWRGWAVDVVRGGAIGAAFAAGGAAALRLLMLRAGERWWLAAAAGSVAVMIVGTFAAPVLLDPIFNDFTPLPPGELRSSMLEMADRAGVKVNEVFSVDASRRTSQVNAYVGGIGATRRIVLFDTLLSSFSAAQTTVVVAHELAHVRHGDVRRGLLFGSILALPGAYAAARLAERIDAVLGRSEPTTLPALVLGGAIVATVVGPPASSLSRSLERRADASALELTDDAEALIAFEQQITQSNLADPDPPRWRSVLFATHPPAVERIGAAVAYAAGRRPA
jgi:STE24 endopeptidase